VIKLATKLPRTTITIPVDLYEKIEDFRFKNRYGSQTKAINELLRAGLEVLEKSEIANEIDVDAYQLKEPLRNIIREKPLQDLIRVKEPIGTLMPQAAHNDSADDEEEQRLMQEDLNEL
jgi:Arc/MetJ-type ribon-helix-helix transcriptional regulator